MLKPNKYVGLDSSYIGQAATILEGRRSGQTVAQLWSEVRGTSRGQTLSSFLISLSLLNGLGLVELENGLLRWTKP